MEDATFTPEIHSLWSKSYKSKKYKGNKTKYLL